MLADRPSFPASTSPVTSVRSLTVLDLDVAATASMADAAFDGRMIVLRFCPERQRKLPKSVERGHGSPTLHHARSSRIRWVFTGDGETRYADPFVFGTLRRVRISKMTASLGSCGHAFQRFALQATALGLKHAFINQPVEVARLRPELASLIGMAGRRPDLVMRFGYGPTLPYSARRPVDTIMIA